MSYHRIYARATNPGASNRQTLNVFNLAHKSRNARAVAGRQGRQSAIPTHQLVLAYLLGVDSYARQNPHVS